MSAFLLIIGLVNIVVAVQGTQAGVGFRVTIIGMGVGIGCASLGLNGLFR